MRPIPGPGCRGSVHPFAACALAGLLAAACGDGGPTGSATRLAFARSPGIESVSQSELTLALSANREATVSAVVQREGVAVPDPSQIRAGLNGAGDEAVASLTTSIPGGALARLRLGPLERFASHRVVVLLEAGEEQVMETLDVPNPLVDVVEGASSAPHRRALLVSVAGETIVEAYFNGSGVDSLQDIRSVTKGILALLVGQAIDRGRLDLGTTIGESFPDRYLDGLSPEKRGITVEHLLTMSSGLGWAESEFAAWTGLDDEIAAVLGRDLVAEPGTTFDYSTPDLQMLSVIFQEATGQDLHEFARENLFGELGIDESAWIGFETGYKLAGGFAFLPARGMLAMGEMVLARGRVDGRQVVSEGYLEAMVTPRMTFPAYLNTGAAITSQWFGYLWWESDVEGLDGFMTAGYGGQNVIVLPEVELVLVTSSNARVGAATADAQQRANWALAAEVVRALELGGG